MGTLDGKKILLGVTGGIAAYKAAEIVRLLTKAGAEVRVVMTRNAREFIGPQTLATLSGQPVVTEMFHGGADPEIEHIRVPENADLALVAPATANFIAKIAVGIADDPLSTMLLVARCPILIAPAMNPNMYAHPTVVENLATLRKRGAIIVEPDAGEVACGWTGPGRLATPEHIFEEVVAAMTAKDLEGEKILVTAGPTREAIDPARYVSNRSSGKMGFALARAALRRGAEVTLISGPTALTPPPGAKFIRVETAEEMLAAAKKEFSPSTILLMAAAVSDYRPESRAENKIKRTKDSLTVNMTACPDILKTLSAMRKKNQILVGFAAETDDILKNAQKKLAEKKLDLIVANQVGAPDSGFDHDTNRIKILDKEGGIQEFPLLTKDEAAEKVLNHVAKLRNDLSPAK